MEIICIRYICLGQCGRPADASAIVFDDIEYTGLKAHIQKFHTEMDDRRER